MLLVQNLDYQELSQVWTSNDEVFFSFAMYKDLECPGNFLYEIFRVLR